MSTYSYINLFKWQVNNIFIRVVAREKATSNKSIRFGRRHDKVNTAIFSIKQISNVLLTISRMKHFSNFLCSNFYDYYYDYYYFLCNDVIAISFWVDNFFFTANPSRKFNFSILYYRYRYWWEKIYFRCCLTLSSHHFTDKEAVSFKVQVSFK